MPLADDIEKKLLLEQHFVKQPLSLSSMQIKLRYQNVGMCLVATFMFYIAYCLFAASPMNVIPDGIAVDLPELAAYCVLAAETGGHAVRMVHDEKKLKAKIKSETDEGASEFVTRADLLSNQLIVDLMAKYPGLKLVSEEHSTDFPAAELAKYKTDKYDLYRKRQAAIELLPSIPLPLADLVVWIDPLDATQEFTEDLTKYVTVMLCIAVRGRPIFGVIYQPFSDEMTFGLSHPQHKNVVYSSAYDVDAHLATADNGNHTIIVSRSHSGQVKSVVDAAFTGEHYTVEPAGGSGYKSLRVLNGTAAVYVHVTKIKKWDICAGDAIMRSAGGHMLNLKGNEITYYAEDSPVNADGLVASITSPYHYLNKIKAYL